MTLPDLMELRSSCVWKNQNSFIKKQQYLSYIDFNIIIPNRPTCFSIAVFCSKWLTPYIICESHNSRQPPCCCPAVLVPLNEHIIIARFCIQREPKSLGSWGISVLHCADSREVTHVKQFRWDTWHQSRSTNTCPFHIKYQISCTFIHWHFHSNKIPNTDSWTVKFPHPVFHISRPVTLIEFPQLAKAFVATIWQIRLPPILLFLTVVNWNLRCRQKYDVIYRDNRSAGSTYEANGHIQTER